MTGKNLTVVDETQPCTSALYGFVCFENEEDAKKVIGSDQFGAIQAIKFSPKDPKDIKRLSNNVYIKNFDAKWDESKFSLPLKRLSRSSTKKSLMEPNFMFSLPSIQFRDKE